MDYFDRFIVTDTDENHLSEILPYLDAEKLAKKLAKENGKDYHILDLSDNGKINIYPDLEDYMRVRGYEPE